MNLKVDYIGGDLSRERERVHQQPVLFVVIILFEAIVELTTNSFGILEGNEVTYIRV